MTNVQCLRNDEFRNPNDEGNPNVTIRMNTADKGNSSWSCFYRGSEGIRTKMLLSSIVVLSPFACCLMGCEDDKDRGSQKRAQSGALQTPCVVLWRFPSYPGPNDEIVSGLVAALCPDGTIVRVADASSVGREYVQGQAGQEDMAVLQNFMLRMMQEIQDKPEPSLVVDAAWEHVWIRSADKTIESAASLPIDQTEPVAQIQSRLMSVRLEDLTEIEPTWEGAPRDYRSICADSRSSPNQQ
jgi:hypothetical protein